MAVVYPSGGGTGVYQYLENQALADLIAGRLPAPDRTAPPAERWGVRFGVRDGTYRDRRALIESLRREIPADGVLDVLADGTGWDRSESKSPDGRQVVSEPVWVTCSSCTTRCDARTMTTRGRQ